MLPSIFLLDTHCLIWFQDDNPQLPNRILRIIEDPNNTICFSQISLFEISIKLKVEKLPGFTATAKDVYEQGIKDGFIFINIENEHIYKYRQVPLYKHHKDPFDRLLIATAIEENCIILSADENFSAYKDIVTVMW